MNRQSGFLLGFLKYFCRLDPKRPSKSFALPPHQTWHCPFLSGDARLVQTFSFDFQETCLFKISKINHRWSESFSNSVQINIWAIVDEVEYVNLRRHIPNPDGRGRPGSLGLGLIHKYLHSLSLSFFMNPYIFQYQAFYYLLSTFSKQLNEWEVFIWVFKIVRDYSRHFLAIDF